MKHKLKNETIAKLNDLAYRTIRHRGLKKKLDERAIKNALYFKKIEDEIGELKGKQDLEGNKERHKKLIEEIGNCPMTAMNVIDAMEEGDCMCIALEISRSEAAIADPTKLLSPLL